MINHYDEVYIVDQRYFQLPLVDFIREHGINELVFANNSFAVCTPYHIRCIDNMRHQVFVPRALQADVPKAGEPEESGEDAAGSRRNRSRRTRGTVPAGCGRAADKGGEPA